MNVSPARRTRQADRAPMNTGRPRREFAGEVEERILDAAAKVFLARGFEGATIDEIAEEARAGKPTIYARFPQKEALFRAVVGRNVRKATSGESFTASGATEEERLKSLAKAVVDRTLASETLGLMRVTLAEAHRFPELASSVGSVANERSFELMAQLLGDLARSESLAALPAFAPERLLSTTRRFKDLVLLPLVVRALFGEDLASLRAEIDSHVSEAVAFFLAGCRSDPGDVSRGGRR